MLRTSPAGIAKLEQREGCVLHAYRDSVGVWTIGVGHSSLAGTPPLVHAGMTITQAQATAILESDLAPREDFMNRLLMRAATQNQFDAMMSLMFNIGDGGFKGSDVLKLFNAGDIKGAAAAFMHWSHPAALANRRRDEAHQFLS